MAIQGQQGRRLGKAMSSMWPDEVAKWRERERERERCVKGEREGKERVIKKRETSLEKKKEREERNERRGERKNYLKKRKKEFFIIAFVTVPFQIWNGIVHPCQIIWHLEHLM